MKIQYVLEEQEALEVLNIVLDEPEAGNKAQHKRDREAYEAWKRKNSLARIMLLSSMEKGIPKGILHEIALNLRRYLAILKLVIFA